MPASHVMLALTQVLAAALGVLPAQGRVDEPRPTFALVKDAKGEPLAGATVTFAGCLPHVGVEYGPADVQHVESDERGRARARLRADLCYVAWATGPASVDGSRVLSGGTGYFSAGALLELRCDEVVQPRRVAVTGLDAWDGVGPLRFTAFTPSPGAEFDVSLTAGRLELPIAPDLTLAVWTADGQPLWQTKELGGEVALPPPQRVSVRVVDEKGAPFAGAVVRQRVLSRRGWAFARAGNPGGHVFREFGVADANGAIVGDVCHAADLREEPKGGDMLLFASAPGRPDVVGGLAHGSFFVDDHKVDKLPDELLFTMRPVEPLVGNLGSVPEGTVAVLLAVCKLHVGGGYIHDPRVLETTVAKGGFVTFDAVPEDVHACRLVLLPTGGAQPLLPVTMGRSLPETASTAAACPAVELQVLDPTGGPARGAVAFAVPRVAGGALSRDAALFLPLDPGGRASARLAPGSWGLAVVTDSGWAATWFDVGSDDIAVELAMQSLAYARIRVRDAAGKPVVGARVHWRGVSMRGKREPAQALLQALQYAAAPRWDALRTDADGCVDVRYMPVPHSYVRLQLQWPEGETDIVELEPAETLLELGPK
jgi:hypothetical protein